MERLRRIFNQKTYEHNNSITSACVGHSYVDVIIQYYGPTD